MSTSSTPRNSSDSTEDLSTSKKNNKNKNKYVLHHPWGWLHVLLTVAVSLTPLYAWYLVQHLDATPWDLFTKGYLFTEVCFLLHHASDIFLQDNFWLNLEIAEANGYSRMKVFINCLVTILQAEILFFVASYYLMRGPDAAAHFDLALVARVVGLLALADIPFSYLHRKMHVAFPKMHLLHHCCIYPSCSTNLIFEQLDVVAEFSVPLILGIGLLGVKLPFFPDAVHTALYDPFALALFFAILQTMFVLGHVKLTPRLFLLHIYHHENINSDYAAFGDFYPWKAKREPNDQVRDLVLKNAKDVIAKHKLRM